jgi:hypothetical protein
MAYVADNLALMLNPIGGGLKKIWLYQTTSDADATIVGSGYFSDGYTKGMRSGDVVFAIATTGPKWKIYQVTTEGTAASPATTVSAPTAIT